MCDLSHPDGMKILPEDVHLEMRMIEIVPVTGGAKLVWTDTLNPIKLT